MMQPMSKKPWSYSTGRRGVSQVRVYERYPGGPLQVKFTGGERQSLTNLAGVPITDRDLAERVADRLSRKLEDGARRGVASRVLGLPEPRTVEELLSRYHRDQEEEWSESHLRGQRRLRTWWTARLGAGTQLREITDARVEEAVRTDVRARSWSPRTKQKYLRYIMATFRYARRKLKWIGEGQDLTAVSVPKPDRGGPSYSHDEMMQLLEAAPGVSLKGSAALEVAYDTQARARAIRHIRIADCSEGLVTFRAKFDKAGKSRVAVPSPTAWSRVQDLIALDPSREWLFEEDGKPVSYDALLSILRAIEEAAGVEHVPGRGWHAVKRRGVTDARRAAGSMGVVSKQSGTLESTLERIYEQDDLEPKRDLALAMERLRRGD